MIAKLTGKISFRGNRFIILDTNGISYKIFVAPETFKKTKGRAEFSLWTHLHVREDALELYGFIEYAELEFFEMLIQIPGIGPKSGLGVLSVAPLDTLKKAISYGETSYLTKVSGIGRKTAEKIVLELRDKLGEFEDLGGTLKEEQDALEALQSLGYTKQESREALKQVPETIEGASQRVKEALKIIGK
jgi:Holliday junction DNA helicase RuvA